MNQRMSKQLWLLGVVGLVLMGFLVACGINYNPSQDGLLLVTSQGAGLIQTYSFTLSNGHVSGVVNSPTDTANDVCVLKGLPSSIVMDPKGQYAYTILNKNTTNCGSGSVGGIAAFKVGANDGTVTQVGNLILDSKAVALTMDPAGKFLFAAEGTSSMASSLNSVPCPGTTAQYGVCVYAIGSGGSLTAVQGTYIFNNGTGFQNPNIVAVAPTPTIFPPVGINGAVNSVCQIPGNQPPPTSQFLYAVDSTNYVVWEFSVDSSGALGNPPGMTQVPYFATDQIPMGVAVDPCDRFAYVSDSQTNKVSAYQICQFVQSQSPCQHADGSLVQIPGSPFAMSGSANGPGPLLVDPFGNFLYVLGTLSNTVSPFKIGQISGAITALTPATVATGLQPTSMVIRADDNWMFVSNYNAATVSQYSISPGTGALSVAPIIQTDNYPAGVAVK